MDLSAVTAETRSCLPGDGPGGMFKEYVDWVLLHNSSPFTICESEEENNAPAMIPVPVMKTAPKIVPEPEPYESSDQMCELAAMWEYWWSLKV